MPSYRGEQGPPLETMTGAIPPTGCPGAVQGALVRPCNSTHRQREIINRSSDAGADIAVEGADEVEEGTTQAMGGTR